MTGIDFQQLQPPPPLSDFVESFWMLSNTTDEEKSVVIVPDGRIDLSFSFTPPYSLTLLGLESQPSYGTIAPGATMYAISFKLLAMEYLFEQKFPTLVDTAYRLPADYFGLTSSDFDTFKGFTEKLSNQLLLKLPKTVDPRKQQLFELVYASHRAITVAEIAETIHWNSRQINRYFNPMFGLSLKAYCTILRFRASFQQIKEGNLFPEQDYADQAHFIKNVKKFSGVTPKELNRNTNDRFIQFSILKKL